MLAIPADGPYLVGRGWTINDNNGDGKVEYAETVTIDCNIKNVGIEDCTNTTFTLSTSDPYIIIIDGQAEAGTVPAKKGNAKECSNYHTTALISHTSKVILKILQARLHNT